MSSKQVQKATYVAIVGEPNVGKSTLLNYLLGKKLSITSRKPQTTRHRLLGVKTQDNVQCVFVDTPGLHEEQPSLMNRYMNRMAWGAMDGVDCILWVVNPFKWNQYNYKIIDRLNKLQIDTMLVVNKIDMLPTKEALLPYLDEAKRHFDFSDIVPISAKNGDQVDLLWRLIGDQAPVQSFFFPPDKITDRPDIFIIAERIREQLTRRLGQELPYALAVKVDYLEQESGIYRIHATIWVERDSQKGIVIGHRGEMLKLVGTHAREQLELYFSTKVFLKLWVKVKKNWKDQEQGLNDLGYNN